MSMQVLTHNFWLRGDYVRTETLPDDLMVTPIQPGTDPEYTKATVCHADSTGKWYIITELDKPVPEKPDVNHYLIVSGAWDDVAPYCCQGCLYAPFKWGVPLQSCHSKTLQYIPVWESVPTGKYDAVEGFPLYEERYKLITLALYCPFPDANTTQHNDSTYFEVNDYGTDLIQLTKDIECFTGIKF